MNEILVSIIINTGTLIGYCYLAVRQLVEVFRPRDIFTPLRILVLGVFLLAVFTLVPSLVYQILRFQGYDPEALRTFVTVTSSINRIASLLLIMILVHYRVKEHNNDMK